MNLKMFFYIFSFHLFSLRSRFCLFMFFTINEVSIKTSLECFCCYYANQYAHVVQHDSLIIVEMKKSADQQDGMQIIHTSIKCTFIHSSVDSFWQLVCLFTTRSNKDNDILLYHLILCLLLCHDNTICLQISET